MPCPLCKEPFTMAICRVIDPSTPLQRYSGTSTPPAVLGPPHSHSSLAGKTVVL